MGQELLWLGWHISGSGAFLIVKHLIWALCAIIFLYPHHISYHFKIIGWAFNPIGKKLIYTHEDWPRDECEWMNFFRFVGLLPVYIALTLGSLAANIVGMIITLGHSQQVHPHAICLNLRTCANCYKVVGALLESS